MVHDMEWSFEFFNIFCHALVSRLYLELIYVKNFCCYCTSTVCMQDLCKQAYFDIPLYQLRSNYYVLWNIYGRRKLKNITIVFYSTVQKKIILMQC